MFCLIVVPLQAQNIGDWTAYLSQSEVNSLTQDASGHIWVATEGGIFIVANASISKIITPLDGLYRPNVKQIAYDSRNSLIWLGFDDGTLQSYNPQNARFRTYTDIRRAERFARRGINAFFVQDELIFVATDFGVVLFDTELGLTRDSYFNLGSFSLGTRVFDLFLTDDTMYLATAAGLAKGSLSTDLKIPTNWQNITENDGLLLTEPQTVRVFGNRLFLHDNARLMHTPIGQGYQNWEVQQDVEQGNLATMEIIDQNELWVARGDTLLRLTETGDLRDSKVISGRTVVSILPQRNGDTMILGTLDSGLALVQEQITYVLPDGPFLNLFSELHFANGVLVAASSDLPERVASTLVTTGFYRLTTEGWQNFNLATRPDFRPFNFRGVYRATSSGTFDFFGSWGRGVAVFDRQNESIRVYNASNSPLRGTLNESSYSVIAGMDTDSQGFLWNTSYTNNIVPLYSYDPEDREWVTFPRLSDVRSDEYYERLFVDRSDKKWIGLVTINRVGRGLLVLRTNPDGTQQGVVLTSDAGNGNLPNDKINAIAQDKRGEMWIGTNRGLARFAFPDRIIDGSNQERQASFIINADATVGGFLLRDALITSIVVDGANRKWIGTQDSGVWVIQEEGGRYRVVHHFTEDNSPLLSNEIQSLAIDEENGIVYIATALGLVSYVTVARTPSEKMAELFIYPNPYSYSRESGPIVIDRLGEQTRIRIVAADGRLVRTFTSRGGRVEWDVRDGNGQKLSSGVYLIIANEIDGEQRGIGRAVIIR